MIELEIIVKYLKITKKRKVPPPLEFGDFVFMNNMRPKRTNRIGVIKDNKTNNFYVLKLIEEEKDNNDADLQIMSRIELYNQVKFPCLPEILLKRDSKTNQTYILTKYYHHGSLQDLIQSSIIENYSLEQKMQILFSITAALNALHTNSFIHGNIKPSNILFDYNNIAILSDITITTQNNEENQEFSMQNDIYNLGKIFKQVVGFSTEAVNSLLEVFEKRETTATEILEMMIQNNFFLEIENNSSIFNFFSKFYPEFIGINHEIDVDMSNLEEYESDFEKLHVVASKFYFDRASYHSFAKSIEILNKISSDPYAAYNLARIYSAGSITELNIGKAFDLFKHAMKNNINMAKLDIAKLILRGYKNNTVDNVINLLESASNDHIAEASFILSQLYEKGLIVKQDNEKSIFYLKIAANDGNIDAMYHYGALLRSGIMIKQNLEEAVQIYKIAAQKGDIASMNKYALLLRNGIGVSRNYIEAAKFFKQAAELNYAEAQNNFGVMVRLGEGLPKNSKISAKYVEKAANLGCSAAQNNFGWMLKFGYGVAKSIDKSAVYFRLSSESGSHFGANNYGLALLFGYGVEKNEKLAVKYFQESAKQGDRYGTLNYGLALYEGIGITQNTYEGMRYIRKAADQGLANAMFLFASICKDGVGVEKDYHLAAKYFKMASDAGHPDAKFQYGMLLKNGTGVVQNEQEAEKYLVVDVNDDDRFFHLVKRRSSKLEMADESDIFSSFVGDEGCCGLELDVDAVLSEFNIIESAEEYLQKAADAGNNQAVLELAYLEKDEDKKQELLEKAANLGNTEAQIKVEVNNAVKKQKVKRIKKIRRKVASENYVYDEIDENEVNNLMNGAELDMPEAHYQLALCYKHGDGVPKDEQKAEEELKKAADLNHVEAMYKYAKNCPDKNESIKYYEKAADKGHEKAKIELAKLKLEQPNGESKMEASSILRELTETGNAEVFYRYAVILRDGVGVPVDLQRSAYYFLQAAKQEYKDAGLQHGFLIIDDKKIQFSVNESKKFILDAMNFRQTDFSLYLLGLFLLTGIGTNRDKIQAISILSKLEDEKSAELVKMYNSQDSNVYSKAVEYLADAGCIEAMFKIASSKKKQNDFDDYIKYVREAAKSDNPQSNFEYGKALFEGVGCDKNIRQGKNMIEKAAIAGNPEAQFYIGKELETGKNIEQDLEKAAKYYENAAENNHSGALFRLAMMNINETAPDSDKKEGVEMLKAAAEAGNPDAITIYSEINDDIKLTPIMTSSETFEISDQDFPAVPDNLNISDALSKAKIDKSSTKQTKLINWRRRKPITEEVEILSFGSDDEDNYSYSSKEYVDDDKINYGGIEDKLKKIKEKMKELENKKETPSKLVQRNSFNDNSDIKTFHDSSDDNEKEEEIVTAQEIIADQTRIIVHDTAVPQSKREDNNSVTVMEDEIDLDDTYFVGKIDIEEDETEELTTKPINSREDEHKYPKNRPTNLKIESNENDEFANKSKNVEKDSNDPKENANEIANKSKKFIINSQNDRVEETKNIIDSENDESDKLAKKPKRVIVDSEDLLNPDDLLEIDDSDEEEKQNLQKSDEKVSQSSLKVGRKKVKTVKKRQRVSNSQADEDELKKERLRKFGERKYIDEIDSIDEEEEEEKQKTFLSELDVDPLDLDSPVEYLDENSIDKNALLRKAKTPTKQTLHIHTEKKAQTPHKPFVKKIDLLSPTNRWYDVLKNRDRTETKKPFYLEDESPMHEKPALLSAPVSTPDSTKVFLTPQKTSIKTPSTPTASIKTATTPTTEKKVRINPEQAKTPDPRRKTAKKKKSSTKSASAKSSPKKVIDNSSDVDSEELINIDDPTASAALTIDTEDIIDGKDYINYSPKDFASPRAFDEKLNLSDVNTISPDSSSSESLTTNNKETPKKKKTTKKKKIKTKKNLSALQILDNFKQPMVVVAPDLDVENIEESVNDIEDEPFKQPTVIEFLDNISIKSKKLASEGDTDEALTYAIYLLGKEDGDADENYKEAMENLEKASNSMNPSAVFIYNQFRDRTENPKRLMKDTFLHFKEHAEEGDPSAMYIYALMLRAGYGVPQDLPGSVNWFKAAAKKGHSGGQYNAGLMLRNGIGAQQNLQAAAFFYKQAADQNNAKAAFNLGLLYLHGYGVNKNEENAAHCFKLAADLGDSSGQANFGLMLKKGLGVEKNAKMAVEMFEMSARQNNPVGMNNLGLIISEGYDDVKPDKQRAAELFRRAAALGNARALYNFGIALAHGSGVESNKMLAARCFQEAADKGNADAQLKIGLMLRNGEILPKDQITALHYIVLSAKQGNMQAMCVLGRMLKNGEGTSKNPELAAKYFLTAAKKGNNIAQLNYGLMLKDGVGVQMDIENAIKYIKMAADNGNAEAQCYFATMLNNGKNIAKDKKLAVHYFTLSADQNFAPAKKFLAHIERKSPK